jgi:prepilin-type N-terminal cleavage/methylation domain-containing protein
MQRQAGFTLLELMIVVTIIAIIAGIAIPNVLSSRLTANETAAIATLRSISTAQAQFQASAKADIDVDGTGEFGGFREMTARWDIRANPATGKCIPPVLSASFREVAGGSDGAVGRSGYLFRILLPSDTGLAVCVDGDATNFVNVDTDLAETTWCCYAWPLNHGSSGNRTFCMTQAGDIMASEDSSYSGTTPTGLNWAAAFRSSRDSSITGMPATGTRGYDGNFWVQVN